MKKHKQLYDNGAQDQEALFTKTGNDIKKYLHRHKETFFHHVHKHHKKYILGSLGYITLHLMVVKLLLVKMAVLKLGLLLMTSLGIYEGGKDTLAKNLDYLEGIHIIQQETNDMSGNTLTGTITSIEEKLGLSQNTIYNFEYQKDIQDILERNCNQENFDNEKNTLAGLEQSFTKMLADESGYSKLQKIKALFEEYKKINLTIPTTDQDEFCKQKYLVYGAQGFLRDMFIDILQQSDLTNEDLKTKKLDETKAAILFPTLDHMIASLPENNGQTHNAAGKQVDDMATLKDKITVLTEHYVQATLDDFMTKNIFNQDDTNRVKPKITLQYNMECQNTNGSFSVAQEVDSDGTVTANTVEQIMLNVNVCLSYQYIENLPRYIQRITTHELGHYVYYFKDSHPEKFTQTCRLQNKRLCATSSFVSAYARQHREEDYAESFSLWTLGDTDTDDSILTQKFDYFTPLFTL